MDNKENEDFEAVTTEDEKEKTPELSSLIHSSHSVGLNHQQDSGIDANSQASSSEPDSNSAKIGSNNSTSSSVGHCATTKNMANSDDSMVSSKNNHSSNMDNSTSNNNITTSNETRASSKGKAKNKKNKKLQGKLTGCKLIKRNYFVQFFDHFIVNVFFNSPFWNIDLKQDFNEI